MIPKQPKNVIFFCLSFVVLGLILTGSASFASDTQVFIHNADTDCEGDDCVQRIEIGDGEHTWLSADGEEILIDAFRPGGGFLGVQLTDLTQELRDHFGIPREAGVMVSKVIAESAAELAGVEVGDVIVSVDQEMVRSGGHLASMIRKAESESVVTLEIWRDGGFSNYPVTLKQRPKKRLLGHHRGGRRGDRMHRIELRCDDGDCPDLSEFDCGEGSECEVKVQCTDSGCDCTVNSESVDCSEIPGFDERHGG